MTHHCQHYFIAGILFRLVSALFNWTKDAADAGNVINQENCFGMGKSNVFNLFF